jgi:outer membrane protein assembly factor BamB
MNDKPSGRRWLALAGTAGVIAAVAGLLWLTRPAPADAGKEKEKGERSWPLFGGSVQRNLVNLVETGLARDWVTVPARPDEDSDRNAKWKNVKWSIPLGSKAYGGPTFGGGKIFLGTNNQNPRNKDVRGDRGIIMCFEEATGKFLWQMIHDKLEGGRVSDWPEEGICSAPVVEKDRIYYVSNRCEVVCATTAGLAAGNVGPFTDEKYTTKTDGDIVWKLDMIGKFGVFPHNLATCSPLIVGDLIFVITSNGVDEGHKRIPKPDAPSFIAVNKKTGEVKWTSKLPGNRIIHGQWSNPVYSEAGGRAQIIFPGGDGWLYSFKPESGELIWKFDCNPKGAKYILGGRGMRNDFVATPVVAGNYLYIGVGQDPEHKKGVGHLWCIDITRTPKNKDRDLSPWSDPKDEAPSKFDPKDPRNKGSALVWHYGGAAPDDYEKEYYFGRSLSTCAVHDGLCYTADFDGSVYCFDAKTGEKHWEYDMKGNTWSSPYWVDGHVYIGNEKGEVHIFKHGKKMELVKKIQMTGLVRATPVALNGVLYVVTENPCRLWAIKP